MVEKNDMLEKALNKNYGVVQKKENQTAEVKTKLAKDFSSNTVNLTKTLGKEMKGHLTLDKELKGKYVVKVKELKSSHLQHTKDIDKQVKSNQTKHQEELKGSLDKFNTANKGINELIDGINKSNEDQIKSVSDQYNKDIETSENEKANINEFGEKNVSDLQSKLKETQDKYEALVVSVNEKRDAKLEKLNTTHLKKVEKLTSEIEKEQLKTDKGIADLKPSFDEKLTDIEKKLATEKEKFNTKDSAIKSTLESRVARHEKFLNKAVSQNDNRSIKEHKKIIIGLEKDADKEVRLLSKEHTDRYTVLNNKKIDLITANSNKIALFETDFVKFKEEKLYQIELCKVTLADELQITKLNTKQTLEDELNKYNEYFADNDRTQAKVIKVNDVDIENQEDIQVGLKITYDKTNQINVIKHQEALSVKDNEFKATELTKLSEENISKLALEVELSKLESERIISEKELVLDILVKDEEELMEYHKNDFNKQASINTEYLNHQSEFSKMFSARAKAITEYEELEMTNRVSLKLAFLEAQKAHVLKDHKDIIEKINQVFESEKAMFETEINKLAKSALDELAKFESEASEEIEVIVKKRNTLNPKAYKKEIRGLDREITDKKEDLKHELSKRKEAINSKTALFNQALEEASVRKFTALNEVESLNNAEQQRLQTAIDLVNKENEDELNDITNRYKSTANDSNSFYSNAEVRNRKMTEENSSYQNSRIEKEEIVVKDAKSQFEQEKNQLNIKLEQSLVEFEKQKNQNIEESKAKILKDQELLEAKIKEYDNQVSKHNQTAEVLISNQLNTSKANLGKIDLKHNNHLTRVTNELKVKVDNFRAKTVEVEKATNEENKSFDLAKKQIQRNYDASLVKGLSIINQKLQQDLKSIK